MINPDSTAPPVTESWDTYWHGTGAVDAYSSGGVSHPAIGSFWDEFFQTIKPHDRRLNIIDIASGNGAVVERLLGVLADDQPAITCVDVSAAAVTNIRSRFPRVRALVANARSIPLISASFDVTTSQFGVEYAGLEAITEAARLVTPGGCLALLLHSQASSIHHECAASLEAITHLQESEFIPRSIDMLTAGFAACRGADRAPYDAAATRLMPAVQALESNMAEHGQEEAAGGTIARLYSDVDRIHRNMQRYEATEVLGWLNRMDRELGAYAGRMSSMCAAALDGATFARICAGLRRRAFTLTRAEPLVAREHDLPLAWALVATK